MEGNSDLGDFSEWLERINESIARETEEVGGFPQEKESCNHHSSEGIKEAIRKWIKRVEQAPKTTWFQELDVRGFQLSTHPEEEVVTCELMGLVDALASMRVFLINTDHLSDEELYRYLVDDIIHQPVAHVPFDERTGIVIDIVACDVAEDPTNWLQFYASNRERMEWAKQNPGKALPQTMETPFRRDFRLPKP